MATAYNIAFGCPWAAVMYTESAGGAFSAGSQDLGTQNTGIAVVTTGVMAETITHIGYHQGTTTGTPAAGSHTVTLQTLTTGLPSGTNVGAVTSTTFTPAAANDNKWVWVSLGGNTYSVTQGQEFAIVLQRTAATDAANKITANFGINESSYRWAFPASALNASGAGWATGANRLGTMGVKSASNVYGLPWTGTTVLNSQSIGSTAEKGMAFTVPATFCSTYKIRGVRAMVQTPSADTNTFVVSIYSSPTASPARVDQTIAMVNNRFTFGGSGLRMFEGYFTSSTQLTAGTEYAIAFATTTVSDSVIYTLDQEAAADFDAWDFRQQTAYTARTASSYAGITAGSATGNFAHTTTKRPWIELILEDITFTGGGTTIAGTPMLRGMV